MMRLATLLLTASSVFTMCEGGPAPEGCCDDMDVQQLNVIMTEDDPAAHQRCLDYGGRPNGRVCEDVDF
jgi:hypothetical protein